MVQGAVVPIVPDVPEGAIHCVKPVHDVYSCHEGHLAGGTGKLPVRSPTELSVDEWLVDAIHLHSVSHVVGDRHPRLRGRSVTAGMGNVAVERNYVHVASASVGEKALHPPICIQALGCGGHEDGIWVYRLDD